VSNENVTDFYENLGFEETEIEDNLSALFIEIGQTGDYALITDEDGALPKSLNHPVIFACYTQEGAYQWSASFKNSQVFQAIWCKDQTTEQKLEAIQNHRKNNEI